MLALICGCWPVTAGPPDPTRTCLTADATGLTVCIEMREDGTWKIVQIGTTSVQDGPDPFGLLMVLMLAASVDDSDPFGRVVLHSPSPIKRSSCETFGEPYCDMRMFWADPDQDNLAHVDYQPFTFDNTSGHCLITCVNGHQLLIEFTTMPVFENPCDEECPPPGSPCHNSELPPHCGDTPQ